jgi:pyruvate formate lyase activating enzyme
MQEANLWHKERNGIRCDLCARNCFVTKDKKGFCLVRLNKDNKLFTLNYGKLNSVYIDKIERKPLFHFYPGSSTLSITVNGCNMQSAFCCPDELLHDKVEGKEYTPEQIVKHAEETNVRSISYTFSEPTIYYEFMYKVAKLAHRSNIANVIVTNCYMTEEMIKKVFKFLDAAAVEIKASLDPEFYKKFLTVDNTEIVFQNLKQLKKQRVFIEISNTIIPQIGDNIEQCRRFAERITTELESEIPFHLVRFQPGARTTEFSPTPIATLEKCIEEARKAGIRYVYTGNVMEHVANNTYCYNCREPLVQRSMGALKKNQLSKYRCPNCGLKINFVVDK